MCNACIYICRKCGGWLSSHKTVPTSTASIQRTQAGRSGRSHGPRLL